MSAVFSVTSCSILSRFVCRGPEPQSEYCLLVQFFGKRDWRFRRWENFCAVLCFSPVVNYLSCQARNLCSILLISSCFSGFKILVLTVESQIILALLKNIKNNKYEQQKHDVIWFDLLIWYDIWFDDMIWFDLIWLFDLLWFDLCVWISLSV
jgi:hypothetical protein